MSKPVWADCRKCSSQTVHTVLCERLSGREDGFYHDENTWQILQCNGCLSMGFRHLYEDFEVGTENEEGELVPRTEVALYPRALRNHRRLVTYLLPRLIRRVYEQTLSAYGEGAFVLASIGLRATIEAICGELKVVGTSLEKRIDKLFKEGHVSNADKKRLHAIRFLGNDAAHEIAEPEESELRVALEIVENLLNSVFILEKRAEKLNSVLENTDEFFRFIDKRLGALKKAQSLSFKGLLGKRVRLVGLQLEELEKTLKEEIEKARFPRLQVGSVEEIDGHQVQLYSVAEPAKDEFEDIPF